MNTRRILLLVVLFVVWYLLSATDLPDWVLLATALIAPFGLLAAALLGRQAIDRDPAPQNAVRVTAAVHDAVLAFLGSGVIAAVRVFAYLRGWVVPLPDGIGLTLVILSGILLLASNANLILRGLGIPIAVLPTRRLASDWVYGWTRNPIVLSGILLLFSLGVWLHSSTLIAWTLLLVLPVMIVLVRVFEERELEIRFGDAYREYRARVPMLIPRPPRSEPEEALRTQ